MSAIEWTNGLRCDEEVFHANCTSVALPEQRLILPALETWKLEFVDIVTKVEELSRAGVVNFDATIARDVFTGLADPQKVADAEPESLDGLGAVLACAAVDIAEDTAYQADIPSSMHQQTKRWQRRRDSEASIFEEFKVDPVRWVQDFTSLVRGEIPCRAVFTTNNSGEKEGQQTPVVVPTTKVQFRALRAYDAFLAGHENMSRFNSQATDVKLSDIRRCFDVSTRWAKTIFDVEALSEIANLSDLERVHTALAEVERVQDACQEPTLDTLNRTYSALSELMTTLKATSVNESHDDEGREALYVEYLIRYMADDIDSFEASDARRVDMAKTDYLGKM